MNSDWERQTFTFAYLKRQAELDSKPGMMITWLKKIGCLPVAVNWQKTNRLPNTNLDPEAITARYLAEFAFEWDSWGGGSTPRQFVDALAFEVRGTSQKAAVSDVLSGLGAGRKPVAV